jgi:hypothetical protein
MFRFFTVFVLGFPLLSHAQENSPYSRYGMGDYFQGQHIISRAMGGVTAAYADGTANNNGQTINFSNPAAYSHLYLISYDIGLTYDSRTLKSFTPNNKFNSNYLIPSYFALGMPLNKKKALGMAFGLRPLSRISYSITENTRSGGDSTNKLYTGEGGLNQFFIGIGKKWKKLSLGFNTGVNFGKKDIATTVRFVNDTVHYTSSRSSTNANFSGFFLNLGTQYEFALKTRNIPATKTTETYYVRLGASGNFGGNMNAKQSITRATVTYNALGDFSGIDTIYSAPNQKGTIYMPSSYTAGISLRKAVLAPRGLFEIWSLNAEYTATQWTKYRYFGQQDPLNDSWAFKVGAQISPDPVSGRSYWGNINYRFGYFTGLEYVNPDGHGLKTSGASVGLGIPIRKWSSYNQQFAIVNAAMQFGKRGTSVNNITESFIRLSFGLSLSDLWFVPRKYD